VERNRVKRRLREVSRTRLLPTLADAGVAGDVVIRARPEAYAASFEALVRQLERAAREVRRILTRRAEPGSSGGPDVSGSGRVE
jgi:ribonuclease P protein component